MVFILKFSEQSLYYDIVTMGLLLLDCVLLQVLLFYFAKMSCSTISFNDDSITCKFLKREWKRFEYNKIVQWGVFSERDRKFIFFAANSIPENEKHFSWFYSQKNIIVLEYRFEIIEFMRKMLKNSAFIEIK